MTAPVTTDDVNTLVAIATARIGFKEIPEATVRVDTQLTTGIDDKHKRFTPVLDALATLAVCDKESQVVAIGLRREDTVFELLIAENGAVNPKVIPHIKELWAVLEVYRTLSAEEKTKKKLEMVKSVYVYSYPKLYRRFTKRKWLADLEYAFDNREKQLPGTSALVTGAKEAISALVTVRTLLDILTEWRKTVTVKRPKGDPKKFPTDAVWTNVMIEMDETTADIEAVLANKATCDEWAKAVEGVGGLPKEPIELFRGIQKLSSQHRYINNLLRYAATPEALTDFQCLFKVTENTVDPVHQNVTIPGNTEPDHLLEKIIMPFLPLGVDQDNEISEITTAVVSLPKIVQGTVHCECSLIANFKPETLQLPRPINYIGVSKLSCSGCHAWIQAYNATQPVQYYTQGTHGRWYSNWAIPSTLKEQPMLAKMKAVVGQAYKSFLEAGVDQVRTIVLSDSTGAGMIPGKWEDNPRPRTKSYASAASRTKRLAERPKTVSGGGES